MKKITLFALPALLFLYSCSCNRGGDKFTEIWGMYEVTLTGPENGNPFTEVTLEASFTNNNQTKQVKGFYDGNGIYKIRFMPGEVGEWKYETSSNVEALHGLSGSFTCTEPSAGNNGPVDVFDTYHFRYANGKTFKQIGTTCYAWIHQGDSLEEITLQTLAEAPFNKLRMCIFPKSYSFNTNEPEKYPFPRDEEGNNDLSRFEPLFWQHLEKRLLQLQELGIEADLILFHPYDRWGYAYMPDDRDEFYLNYAIARLSAFRNVWWSVANEFDFMNSKSMSDWHRIFEIIHKNDPYDHLLSIHNGAVLYDHALPWVTHASLQTTDYGKVEAWRASYKKPLIFDECRYEGDIEYGWGNLTPEEMTAMFWRSLIHDIYAGHGETYLNPQEILWWSKGGTLNGQSVPRIEFYKRFLEETPPTGLDPIDAFSAGKHDEQYIYYFDQTEPLSWTFNLSPDIRYSVEVIDTWNMTCDLLDELYTGTFTIPLPGKKQMAVRITRSELIFPLKEIETDPPGDLFYQLLTLKLSHPYPEMIRYTLDGSEPGPGSATYRGAIEIRENTTLKACIFDRERQGKLLQIHFSQPDLKQPVTVSDPVPGIEYAFFEGVWERIPDFSSMEPKKRGIIPTIHLQERLTEDYFGFVFRGFIKVTEDNIYTFYLSSDDGSSLLIDGEQVILNDGIHGIVEKSGQVGLMAGFHAIEIRFFDNWYDQVLKLDISSPVMKRQMVDETMLFVEK